MHEFLPIKHGNKGLTLEATIHRVKLDQSLLADHLVPFAVDPGGNFYCFSVREDNFGEIFLFLMDYYDNPKRSTEYLTSSLRDFLAGLTVKKGGR